MGDLQLSLGSPIRSLSIFFLLLHRGEMWQQGEEACATQVPVSPILAHPQPSPCISIHCHPKRGARW